MASDSPRPGQGEDLERLAEAWLNELTAAYPLSRRPTLRWKSLKVSAGIADYRRWEIRLSRVLLVTADRLRSTLLHEYAHLLAVDRAGREGRGHGAAWRRAMRDLGEPAEVTHRYEVERMPRRLHYRCDACGAVIRRARRLARGRIYFHAGCGGRVREAITIGE